jgi:hypothetical protein
MMALAGLPLFYNLPGNKYGENVAEGNAFKTRYKEGKGGLGSMDVESNPLRINIYNTEVGRPMVELIDINR